MSFLNFQELNWLAIAAATAAAFVVGGLWYAVIFGKAWMKAYAFSETEIKAMSENAGPKYATVLVCDFLVALILALFAAGLGVQSVAGGALLGFVAWLGMPFAGQLATHIMSNRPLGGFVIDTGKHLASFVVTGMIVGGWR